MIDPVATQHLLAAAAAGALIIIFGALYALLFAQSVEGNNASAACGIEYTCIHGNTVAKHRNASQKDVLGGNR